MVELFVKSGDADQMPNSTASDLGLHCLQNTLLDNNGLKWICSNCRMLPFCLADDSHEISRLIFYEK